MKITRGFLTCTWILALGCGTMEARMAPVAPVDPARTTIEESDLARRDGPLLYVQNPVTGLNVVDLLDPEQPRLIGRAPVVGLAGELYLHQKFALILLKSASSGCQALPGLSAAPWRAQAELAVVSVHRPSRPALVQRWCVPGDLVASRLVNDFLILVTQRPDGPGALALSLDAVNPAALAVVDQATFPSASKEIHVTEEAMYVAGLEAGSGWGSTARTVVQYVSISGINGSLWLRGSLSVPGEPQGRFHLDAHGTEFRIVTFDPARAASHLSVIDFAAPDQPQLLGSLPGIGTGERLYATRFDGDQAYVVTFRRTDPLWVIDLRVPAEPRIVGELIVPGWSDYLFPRGDRLLAVGRGNGGAGLQVSLFDVSEPSRPRALSQIVVGDWGTSSEANLDHRAVTVVEPYGELPLVVVPFRRLTYGDDCQAADFVQLVDLTPSGLRRRGIVKQQGLARRTLDADGLLLSVSDYQVLAVDPSDRDRPLSRGAAVLGETGSLACSSEAQTFNWEGLGSRRRLLLCQSGEIRSWLLPFLMVLVGLVVLRRPRRLVQSKRDPQG